MKEKTPQKARKIGKRKKQGNREKKSKDWRVRADTKKAQTQTFESGYFLVCRGLPREGVGAKKFGMSFETREIKLFSKARKP